MPLPRWQPPGPPAARWGSSVFLACCGLSGKPGGCLRVHGDLLSARSWKGAAGKFLLCGRQAVGVLPVSPCFSLPPPPFSSNEAFTRQSAKNTCLKGVCDSKPTDTGISLCLQNCFPELLFAQNLPGDGNAGGFRSLSALLV